MCTIPASETNESGNNIYMHRYLMDEYSNDRQKTIDHKNQDKTDNRLENLHLVNQSFQNHNRKRKERKEILIAGFETSIKLPEYISYIKEPKIKVHTPVSATHSGAIAIVSIEGKEPSEIDQALFKNYGIHTVAINWENIHGVRITPHVYTSKSDLDRLIEGLISISKS
jgi:selenocysteine lyase/cysteine desulfurase